MGRKQEKGKKGEAVQYYSRKQALRHLQINLPNFNRLCSWKSIYPTQPNNLKVVGKGDTRQKLYYKRKDINLLLHEPVLNKLREIRVHSLKLKRAKERKDKDKILRLKKSKPRYKLDHIVRELYPTPEDALRNLNDCLNTIFIFATLPILTQFNGSYISLCKRLKLEFMNYCIYKQCVRKCYISVKGFHVEVEIKGISIIWLMPHHHTGQNLLSGCDYRTIANQMEFDCTMLCSLLKNLYTDAGLMYPPKFVMKTNEDGIEWRDSDILASMSFPLATVSDEELQERLNQLNEFREMDPDIARVADNTARIAAIQTLFQGKKVFLNREVPREIFCFLLRSCGANVSWDDSLGNCAPYPSSDTDIDFLVIDRPVEEADVNRFYVVPQFVVDSINAARLLPVRDYMPGATLISHLSPFADYVKGYVPPEYRYLLGEIDAEALHDVDSDSGEELDLSNSFKDDNLEKDENKDMDDEEEVYEGQDDVYEDQDDVDEEEVYEEQDDVYEDQDDVDEEEDDDEEIESTNIMDCVEEEEEEEEKEIVPENITKKENLKNRKSKSDFMKEVEEHKQKKLLEMSLPKKRLNLYKKMKHAEKREKSNVEKMKQKRQDIDRKRKSSNK